MSIESERPDPLARHRARMAKWEDRAEKLRGRERRDRFDRVTVDDGAHSPDLATRFWSKVGRREPDACWPWLSKKRRRGGYGAFSLRGKSVAATHVALELSGVALPEGAIVLHKCDNPPCCNPAHLVVGTSRDNMLDMVAKGRARPVRGETHSRARLSDANVKQLCERARRGENRELLAVEFGITVGYVSTLLRGERRAS